jgi:hypothetical protein
MADPNEPKKETVRIALPQEPVAKPRDTVRIQLPPGQSPNNLPHHYPLGAPRPPAEAVVPPSPFALPETSLAAAPEPVIPSAPAPAPDPRSVSAAPESVSPGPRKETARVPVMPEPPAMPAPAVEMKKTQPLFAMPQITPQRPSIAVTAAEKGEENAIPMPICWVLLGVSTVILIIQILTYFS